MMHYSVQTTDRIFVKGYVFLSSSKNISKSFGKNICKNISSKYSQKLIDHTKQSATDALKNTTIKAIQKMAEATGDLTGAKIADKITKVSKTSPQNSSETIESETENTGFDMEIAKERYISPLKRQKIIDNLRLT